jgi:hypothetical protein
MPGDRCSAIVHRRGSQVITPVLTPAMPASSPPSISDAM